MPVRAIIDTSLIDWDGKIAMVLFFGGCNFQCPFCQNWELARDTVSNTEIGWDVIAGKLAGRKDWIDGVVISGGEPLLDYENLVRVCGRIGQLGFAVKLDTNGSRPDLVEKISASGLVKYIAMDIKAPLDNRYEVAAGQHIDVVKIRASIDLLINGFLEYEFRTTLVPTLVDKSSIIAMAQTVKGARLYALQQFVPRLACNLEYRELSPFTKEQAQELADAARPYVEQVKLRGF